MAINDPQFIAKGGVDDDARQDWIDRFTGEAQVAGCTHIRVSERPGLMLLEGWVEVPEDAGDPRWE